MQKQINIDTITSVDIHLLVEQIKLILESLELYAVNSRYLLNNKDVNSVDTLVLTYEQLGSILYDIDNENIFDSNNIKYLKTKNQQNANKQNKIC